MTAQRLARLEEIERDWKANDPRYPDELPDEDFYGQLTLTLGLKRVRASLDWCEECLERMQQRERLAERKRRA